MLQRLTIYVSESVAEQVRDDAHAKGQTLSMWFTRAAEAHLTVAGLIPKGQAKLPKREAR